MARGNIANFGDKKHTLTQEDRVKGGNNSSISRAENANMAEAATDLLAVVPKGVGIDKVKAIAEELGIDIEGWSIARLVVLIQVVEALAGNLNAMNALAEYSGQKPAAKQQLTVDKLPNIWVEKTPCETKK